MRSILDKGYLVEVEDGVSQGGRKPRLMRFNGSLGYVVGIDLGATSVEIALADAVGTIVQRVSEPADVHQPAE